MTTVVDFRLNGNDRGTRSGINQSIQKKLKYDTLNVISNAIAYMPDEEEEVNNVTNGFNRFTIISTCLNIIQN
jgi:hypothetical protein